MTADEHDLEAGALTRELPAGRRVGVIGSIELERDDSETICAALGRRLAASRDVVLITGGVCGVGETVGRAFVSARPTAPVFHVLPRGDEAWDYGTTVFAGDSMEERREILARLASVYLCIEGGLGTAHEAAVARRVGAAVLPVARTGGVAKDLHATVRCPVPALESDWLTLDDASCSVESLASAVGRLVERLTAP